MSDIVRLYPTGRGFSQVVIARGDKHVFVAGQCAVDDWGEIVGEGDLAAQTEQVMKNIQRAVTEAGGTLDDLVRLTIYVVDYEPAKRQIMQTVRDRFIPSDGGPASTLIGVSRLVDDRFLIEIEAQAIVGD